MPSPPLNDNPSGGARPAPDGNHYTLAEFKEFYGGTEAGREPFP